jgi:hypothetical protein
MNQRYKKLLNQAYIVPNPPGTYSRYDNILPEQMERFVESVVLECDKIMQKHMKSHIKDVNESFEKSGWKNKAEHDSYKDLRKASTGAIQACRLEILEHFGVNK